MHRNPLGIFDVTHRITANRQSTSTPTLRTHVTGRLLSLLGKGGKGLELVRHLVARGGNTDLVPLSEANLVLALLRDHQLFPGPCDTPTHLP